MPGETDTEAGIAESNFPILIAQREIVSVNTKIQYIIDESPCAGDKVRLVFVHCSQYGCLHTDFKRRICMKIQINKNPINPPPEAGRTE